MKRFTERYFRTETQWTKVTRDNQARKFIFARGHKGNFQAHEISELPFKWIPNWDSAKDRAESAMANFS
jgi:hypothetical protein